jgi:2'-5' RNA ligase
MEEYSGGNFSLSALILPIPEIASVAQPYRRRDTTDGAMGVLPHITILYPFITHSEWNPGFRENLETRLSTFSPFTFKLARLNHFPTNRTLFLDPVPHEPILDLTRALVKMFPDYLPYEGAIPLDELYPHVTIATGSTDQDLYEIEESFSREIADQLPLAITAREVWFIVKSGNCWQRHTTIPLGVGKDKKVDKG